MVQSTLREFDRSIVSTKPRLRRTPAKAVHQDMLIALYALPAARDARASLDAGLVVRLPLAPEHDLVVAWVRQHFTPGWASEVGSVIARRPCGVVIAVDAQHLLGFCCHDAFAPGFVGPIGVAEDARGRGVGAALLCASLERMRLEGYAYAVAGAVGAPECCARVARATPIEGSSPGAYRGLLKS
jgi:ribosomal protein S18 acetylase RimI-like enzyme